MSPRLRQVRCAGALVEAQPKVFDLLLYLIEHRDRVVDKDELFEKLWPGLVVSESALNQIVRKARALVGDDGARQAVIRTVQRRGFRFIAPLETSPREAPATPAAPERRAPTANPEPSVAVLPFVDMSPERDQEYFCDGMAEEVINELAKVPGLRVAARTSTFAFKQRADDVREIGRRLGVRTVLEGSVRKAGDRLRVTAQLIDAETGFHLWSERWDRRLEDMLAIQSEIAQLIAAGLRRPRAERAAPPLTVSAVDDYCERGFVYLHRHGQRSQRFAMDLFRQALALDPQSARAWAGLSLSHMVSHRGGPDPHRDAAADAAERACGLDPRSAEAWTARGAVATLDGDFAAASQAFSRAIELDPTLFEAHYYYGHACTEDGRHAQAAELYERAAELQPNDYQALVFAVTAYRALGLREQERGAALRQLAAAERALAADPTDARALSLGAGSLAVVGRVAEAREWARRACELEPDESYPHYNAACLLAQLGELEEALDLLEGGPDGGRFCRPSWLAHDEDLAPLRGHPRFQALLASRTQRFAARGDRHPRAAAALSRGNHGKVRA
ncbi:MAG TPA: tetratricopeptide repeat protein [Gammaproteobacteria bacterium]